MVHTIETRGEGDPQKFVTITTGADTYRTRLHLSSGGPEVLHLKMISDLLIDAGIADVIEAPDYMRLKKYDASCVGGGKIDGDCVMWNSSGLRIRLKRDQPEDKTLADQLIGDIRAWVKQAMEAD